MSGHSKFANIKHKKEKNDAAKGKIFTVIGRELAVAVKEGGPDPANNSKLRDVIAKAKANNMPNDTIDRGIKKAAGDANSVNYVQCSSEADKLTNVAAGSIDIANCSIPNAESYDADNKITVLGSLGPKVATLENMSELVGTELDEKFATTQEQGIDVTWDSNYYVLAPKDTPDEICEAINEALCKASEVQSFIDGNNSMATYIAAVNYEDTKKALDDEWAFQDGLVSSMGLKVR